MTGLVTEERQFSSGEEIFGYRLRRTKRRRTVGILVEPDRGILVLTPVDSDVERIEKILRRRLPWIRRQTAALSALPADLCKRQWVSGETHRYMGRQYRLRVGEGTSKSVRLTGGFFEINVPSVADRRAVQHAMEGWYRAHALEVIHARVAKALAGTTWLDVKTPTIAVRRLRQRWGSATPSGRLLFNIDLVKLPVGCVDYVVCHELVHLQVPDHSDAFWRLLTRVMPDWKRWRERLASVEY